MAAKAAARLRSEAKEEARNAGARAAEVPEPRQSRKSQRFSVADKVGGFQDLLQGLSDEYAQVRDRAMALEREVERLRAEKERIGTPVSGEDPATEDGSDDCAAKPIGRQSMRTSRRSQGRSQSSEASTVQDHQVSARSSQRKSVGFEEATRSIDLLMGKVDVSPSMSSGGKGATSSGRFAVASVDEELLDSSGQTLGMFELARARPMSAAKRVVRSGPFEYLSGAIILASAFFIGLETQYLAKNAAEVGPIFGILQTAFNVFFVMELGLRYTVEGRWFFTNREWRWNWLDFVLGVSSLVDVCIFFSQAQVTKSKAMSGLRAVRLLRLLRTVRLFRTLKSVREFRKMLYAILSSMRTLMCSIVILFFVVYFFAILLCQGVTEFRFGEGVQSDPEIIRMYGDLPKTVFTLFAAISNGVSWELIMQPLSPLHIGYSLTLGFYIALVLFGVMNVLTSVFVESAVMSAQHYKDLIVQEKQYSREVAMRHMREVFKQMDVDGSGCISHEEMEFFLTDPNLRSYVDALGISAESTRMLFRLVDADSSGRIDVDEFCEGCLRLQGDAKSIDVHTMIYQVRAFLTRWAEFTDYVEERFAALYAKINEDTEERNELSKNMRSVPQSTPMFPWSCTGTVI